LARRGDHGSSSSSLMGASAVCGVRDHRRRPIRRDRQVRRRRWCGAPGCMVWHRACWVPLSRSCDSPSAQSSTQRTSMQPWLCRAARRLGRRWHGRPRPAPAPNQAASPTPHRPLLVRQHRKAGHTT
jgi:hypothetical protein